jgi:hypothetical protein
MLWEASSLLHAFGLILHSPGRTGISRVRVTPVGVSSAYLKVLGAVAGRGPARSASVELELR